jgi:hypothetical protein
MDISQSASLENWGSLLFIIFAIDFSSLSSFSSSLLLCATVCAERKLTDDGVGDGDLLGDGDLDLDGFMNCVLGGDGDRDEVVVALTFDLRLTFLYFD